MRCGGLQEKVDEGAALRPHEPHRLDDAVPLDERRQLGQPCRVGQRAEVEPSRPGGDRGGVAAPSVAARPSPPATEEAPPAPAAPPAPLCRPLKVSASVPRRRPPVARAHAILLRGGEVDEQRLARAGHARRRLGRRRLCKRCRPRPPVQPLARLDGGGDAGVVSKRGPLLGHHPNRLELAVRGEDRGERRLRRALGHVAHVDGAGCSRADCLGGEGEEGAGGLVAGSCGLSLSLPPSGLSPAPAAGRSARAAPCPTAAESACRAEGPEATGRRRVADASRMARRCLLRAAVAEFNAVSWTCPGCGVAVAWPAVGRR